MCSVPKSCLTLCDPVDCSTPGLPVIHYLPEFAQTHVHPVGDAIQPSHPLSPPSPPGSIFPSIRVFSNELALHIRWPSIGVSASASVLPMNIQGCFPLGLTGLILLSKSSLAQFESVSPSVLSFPCGPALTSIHDYWKNHSFD